MQVLKKGILCSLLAATTIAITAPYSSAAGGLRFPVYRGTVQGAKQGARVGKKAAEAAHHACELYRQKHPNEHHHLCHG